MKITAISGLLLRVRNAIKFGRHLLGDLQECMKRRQFPVLLASLRQRLYRR